MSFAGPLRRPLHPTEVREGNRRPDIRVPQRICGLQFGPIRTEPIYARSFIAHYVYVLNHIML